MTGPWEIHTDCLQHMSYIIASICTPTTTCELQMCTSPVISVQTEEEEGGRGGDFGLKTKSQIEHCLFSSSLHDLSRVGGEKREGML